MKRASQENVPEIPESLVPVVILSGSDYEMGYQFGQQAANYFEMKLDEIRVGMLGYLSYDALLDQLAEWQRSIKQYAPEAIDMMQGIADGVTNAGFRTSYLDVLLLNSALRRPLPEEEELASSGCTGFAAWGRTTKDGSLICTDSLDDIMRMTRSLVTVAFPDKGNNYITMSYDRCWPLIHPGMNNKGLVYVHHGGGATTLGPQRNKGLPSFVANLHTLRFANDANEAREMQLGFVTGAGGQWVDMQGNNCVIEFNETRDVRQAGDYGETDFLYSTNNMLCREPQQASKEYIEHGGWYKGGRWGRCSIGRNLEIWNMLHNYQGKVDLDFIKMMWRFPGDPPPYPCDPETYIATNSKQWDQKICHMANKYVTVMLPDKGDRGKMYVCQGPVGRVAYRTDPTGYAFSVAPTNTFFELTLASNPSGVAGAAKNAASTYLAETYDKLMWLKPTDVQYSGLNELFSMASAEFYEGATAYNKGMLTRGNEVLLYLSEAATAFGKSQVHAKQVFEALVPPPACPSDIEELKDKPWFGDWGKWAKR